MKLYRRALYSLIIVIGLSSCAGLSDFEPGKAETSLYTVQKSDTIYAIAWHYGLDYQELARWNQIAPDFIIHPGQRLRLDKPENFTLLAANSNQVGSAKKTTPTSQKKSSQAIKTEKMKIKWRWPTSGKIMNTFAANELDRKGIDIAGKLGQAVRAVANGKVVYSGNGLAGYGNLIIIKHNDTYLSAYAYNQQRLVKEGMTVKGGTVISKMGKHPDGTTRLHFEIRKNGNPVDPLRYMPRL